MANSRKPVNLVEQLVADIVALLGQHAVHGRHLALGLSGGMDSCVLLDLLVQAKLQIDFRLSVIHINHQISPNADAWERFCAELALHHRIPFTAIKVNVSRDSGLGLEAAARDARYQAFAGFDCDMIALAHHQDDQAETFLLQLLRGAGINGLAAMPISRHERILRPLLDIPRSEIERHAQASNLRWVEDESNINLHFDRNFLRQQLLPGLVKRFPCYRTTLTRTAEHIAGAAALLEQLAVADARHALKDSHGRQLDINVLRAFSTERAANLMRWWIREQTGLILSTSRLHNIIRQLCDAKENARIECKLEQQVLRRYRDSAYIVDAIDTQPYELIWRGESTLQLPGGDRLLFVQMLGQGIAVPDVAKGLLVNNRRGNLSIRTHSNRPARSLKNLWQEAGIPPWERDRTPLIWQGKDLVAVPGLGIASDWQVAADQHGWLVELVRHH